MSWVDIVFQVLAFWLFLFSVSAETWVTCSYLSASFKTSNDYFNCSSMFIVLHRMLIFSTKIFIYIILSLFMFDSNFLLMVNSFFYIFI